MTDPAHLGGSVTINLVCCTEVLLQDIGTKQARQKDVALSYSLALRSFANGADKPNWPKINRAIIDRWGQRGLTRIKNLAWAYAEGRKSP